MAEPTPHTPQAERPPLGYLLIDRLIHPQFLLALVSGGFLWWLAYRLLAGSIPENARELVAALVGFISGQMVGPAWQFFLGTTVGSEKKTIAMADSAAQQRRESDLKSGDPTPVVIEQPRGQPVPVAQEPRDPLRFQPPEDPDLAIPPTPPADEVDVAPTGRT